MLPILGPIAAGVGLYQAGKSLFGGGKKKDNGLGSRLTDMVFQDLGRSTSPTADASYRSGVGELRRLTQQQAEADAARVATTGLQGGELEVALAGSRQDALSAALSDLLGRSQDRAEQGRLSRLGLLFGENARREALAEQARQRRTNAVVGGISALASAIGGGGPAPTPS